MECQCRKCMDGEKVELFGNLIPKSWTMMVVCQKCGNKRCPHAESHENECTNSNEPGQPGSSY